MKVAVFAREELEATLTHVERAELARLGYAGERAREWIAGRAAAHRVLGDVDVMTAADGAPRIEHGALSLAHDEEWVAVASAEGGRVAVDLCARTHARRLVPILARLGIRGGDPCLVWAALECALKLRRNGVWNLLDAKLAVELTAQGARITGIGDPVDVCWRTCDGYALAWAEQRDPPPRRRRRQDDEEEGDRAARDVRGLELESGPPASLPPSSDLGVCGVLAVGSSDGRGVCGVLAVSPSEQLGPAVRRQERPS